MRSIFEATILLPVLATLALVSLSNFIKPVVFNAIHFVCCLHFIIMQVTPSIGFQYLFCHQRACKCHLLEIHQNFDFLQYHSLIIKKYFTPMPAYPRHFNGDYVDPIDNQKKEVSTKLWYLTIGHLATRWLSPFSGVAQA